MKESLVVIFTLVSVLKAYAQETVTITKNELEEKININNLQVKLAEKEEDLAAKELLASRALYLPNVSASYSFIQTNNPMMAFGYKLNQRRITMNDFDPAHLNSPGGLSHYGARLEVQQPILNMDAVYQKKAGQVKIDVMNLKTERTKEHISFELNKAYMMLQMAYKVLETLEAAKVTIEANRKLVNDYFQNGLLRKPDVLTVDVKMNEIESQVQTAKSNIKNASDFLYFLIDEDAAGKTLKPSEQLEYVDEPMEADLKIDANRKDLRALQKSLESYYWMIKSSSAKLIPKLNAFGSYDFADNKIARFGANSYMAGIQLSWNIFDGLMSNSGKEKYKAELSRARIELTQYTRQSQLELNRAYRQVIDAKAKLKLSDAARKQSSEVYRILKNRYEEGLEKTADLLTAETLMTQKELEYHQSVFEHNLALAYLRLLKK